MESMCQRCRVYHVIFHDVMLCHTSSNFLQVYGDPLEHPQTESYWGNVNPIGERSCYDEGESHLTSLPMKVSDTIP